MHVSSTHRQTGSSTNWTIGGLIPGSSSPHVDVSILKSQIAPDCCANGVLE